MQEIDWIKVSEDLRPLVKISQELGVNEKTIRRNLKKLGLVKKTKTTKFSRGVEHNCSECGKTISRGSTKCLSCSKIGKTAWAAGKKFPQNSRENHYRWKLNTQGYRTIHLPEHPNSNKAGYIAEHRLVVEKFIGRYLTKEEVVHHIDENKQNNKIENLMIFKSARDHAAWHNKLKRYGYHTGPMRMQIATRWAEYKKAQ